MGKVSLGAYPADLEIFIINNSYDDPLVPKRTDDYLKVSTII